MKQLKWFFILVLLMSLLAGCTPAPTPTVEMAPPTTVPAATDAPVAAPATERNPKTSTELILATTTSTRNSGLLDVLLPLFEAQSGL